VSRRREARLRATADRRRDAPAVGLVADDDHGLAAAGDGCADVVRGRARSQPVVRRSLHAEGPRELVARLARAEQRAREDRVRPEALAREALAELPGRPAPRRREAPKLVGLAGFGLGVSDQVELHRAEDTTLAAIVPRVRSPVGRIAIVAGTVVVLVVLFVVLRGRDDDEEAATSSTTTAATTTNETTTASTTASTTTTTTAPVETTRIIHVDVGGGQVAGGVKTVRLKKNEWILLIVQADVSDEVHVHGYDVMRDIAPGGPAQIRLRATLVGRFEVELEDRKLRILELEVRP